MISSVNRGQCHAAMAGDMVMMLLFITSVFVVGILVMIIALISASKVFVVRFFMRIRVIVRDHYVSCHPTD
jgi:hypothetical protein